MGCHCLLPAPPLESINSLVLSLLYGLTLTSVHDYWKNHSFEYMDLCWFHCFKGEVSGSMRCPLSSSDGCHSGHPSAKVTWSGTASPGKRGSNQRRGPLLRSLSLLALSQSLGGQPSAVTHICSSELFKSWNNNYKREATHKTGIKKKGKAEPDLYWIIKASDQKRNHHQEVHGSHIAEAWLGEF